MLKELFERELRHLEYFFKHLDINNAESIFQVLFDCKGVMIFTGIGKSGHIAEKIAVTMTSTGSRALYLSPTNALHGDIGIVTAQDVFVILSKSGESDELLQLIPFLRNRCVPLIAVVSNKESRLAKACDHVMYLPFEREICPYDMAPTVSTVIQMIFGDVMAIGLMRSKNFSLAQYAMNHPAGRIGKRIAMKVSDLMIKDEQLPKCPKGIKLMDSLLELSDKKCGCILVVDESDKLEGIFTDGDLRRALQTHGSEVLHKPIDELMTVKPRWIVPEELAWSALQVMEKDQKQPITVLPVLDNGRNVKGLIKMHDIIQSGIK